MSLPGFVFYCEHGGNCKWQGFALHKGLGWGKVPVGSEWHRWHEKQCGGTLTETAIPIPAGGSAASPAPAPGNDES